jgi:hypothetical protein
VFHQICALDRYPGVCLWLAGLERDAVAPASERRFAFERLRDVCSSIAEVSYYDTCHQLAHAPTTPPDIRRFALDRICHSKGPDDACGRLRDLAIP